MRNVDLSGIPGWFKAWFVFCLVMGLGSAGFIVWVVLKVMKHYGIL
jgi:hypothetical protein